MFNNLSTSKKLFSGFLSIIFTFVIFAIYQIMQINNMGEIQDEGAQRAKDTVMVMEFMTDLGDMYAIAADGVINGYSLETKQEFSSLRKEVSDDIETLTSRMDTPEEKQWIQDYKVSTDKYMNIIENELFFALSLYGNPAF